MNQLFRAAVASFRTFPRRILGRRSVHRQDHQGTLAGEQLRDEEAMLGAAQRLAGLGFWVYDVPAQQLSWSGDSCSIHGVSQEQLDGSFSTFLGCVHPEDRAAVSEAFQRALAGEKAYTYEYRFRAADGTEKSVRGAGETRFDTAGRVCRLLGTVMDVTEQVELRNQVQHSTDRLRTRSDASWECYWEQDEEFRYVLFECGPGGVLASARPELLGRRMWELPDCTPIRSTWSEHRERLEAREEFRDLECRRGTGLSERFLSLSGEPRYRADGAFIGYRGMARDVTLRMRAEQRAREIQTMLELASRLGRLGAWAVDVPEMTVTWSAEALAIHELEEGATLTLEGVHEQAHPDWRAKVDAAIDECIHAGAPFDIEVQVYTARGRLIWVRLIGEAMRDVDGQVRRVHGAVQDISERKIQAERYRELSERLTSTLDSVTDAFFTVDRNWRFTYINAEAERLMRRRRVELMGRIVWEEFPEAVDSISHREYERAFAENRTVEFEHFYPPLQLWAQVTAYPSAQGLAVYFRDVTEQRKAREALSRSEERYRLLFESSVDGIFHTSPDGQILSANSAACAMFRMTEEDLRRVGRRQVIAPEDTRLSDLLQERRLRGRARGELSMVRGDGTRFEAEITSAQYCDSDGTQFTMVAVRDITERMQHREEILRLNADLARRVRDRTAELEAANAQLKGFAHSLAHDLRGPIAAIDMFGENLEGMLAPTAGEREMHYLRRIRAAGRRMNDFVSALLALATLSQADLHLGEVNLSEIAATVLADLQEQARSRRVAVRVQDGLLAWGDARLLRMALDNLLGNAWKFTAQRDLAEISFTARSAADGDVVYCIEDNGAGFDMRYADRLFGNFQRLHSEAEFPGIGIGLANVHRIIGRHAGRVWAESIEGSGARFYFTLGGSHQP